MTILVHYLLERRILLFAAGILLFGALVAAPSTTHAQQCLDMTVSYPPIQQLSITDIDFEHFESRSLLFTLNIRNTGSTTVNAKLLINVSIDLADGSLRDDNALEFVSKEFPVPVTGITISNLNIGRYAGIKTEHFQLSDRVKDKVKDVALATGKFPAGRYVFNLTLDPSPTCTPVSTPVVFTLENPSRVELRSPRDGETTNAFPLFEFSSDGNRSTITVAEKSSEQSREDAIDHMPPMLSSDLVNQNSFLYSGGRPLEAGKTYVWKVVSKVHGSGGNDITIESPISLFTVGTQTGDAQAEDQLLLQIEQLLGPRYHGLIQQIRDSGFALTGTYDLNGEHLSQSDLLKLVNELRAIANDIDASFE